MAEKDTDDRLEQLYGALAGIAASESTRLPGSIGLPAGMLSEIGEKAYHWADEGMPLWAVDPKRAYEARQIRKAVGAPRVPIVVGPEDMVLTPSRAKMMQRFPWLFGTTASEAAMAVPEMQLRAPSYAGMAHEIGHTKPSPVQTAALIAENPILRALAVAGGVSLALSDEEAMQAAAPFVSAAPHVPTLAEEVRATYHAGKGVRAVKGNAEAAKAVARLLPAFLSHAVHLAPAIAAPLIAKAVKEYAKKKKGEKKQEKTAAKTPKLKVPKPPSIKGKLRKPADRAWAPPAVKPKTSKIGKPGRNPASPPSKSSYYKDIMLQMKDPQRGHRLGVVQSNKMSKKGSLAALAGVGSMLGGKLVANAIAHAVVNTKMSPAFLRKFIESAGDDFMAAGFRHAVQGKKIHAIPQAIIGTAVTPSAPYLYQSGYKYGKRVAETMKQIPYVSAQAPFKVMKGLDVGASKVLEKAPIGGGLAGVAYGAKSGRDKGKTIPLREMATSGVAGMLLGKGAKHYGPHAPGFKHLKWVRNKVVDPVLEGSGTKLGKALDAIATKTKG